MPVIDDEETKVGEDLDRIIVTKEVMLGKLMELNVDKSPDPDGMHPSVLKEMVWHLLTAFFHERDCTDPLDFLISYGRAVCDRLCHMPRAPSSLSMQHMPLKKGIYARDANILFGFGKRVRNPMTTGGIILGY
eukprot:g36351.t1